MVHAPRRKKKKERKKANPRQDKARDHISTNNYCPADLNWHGCWVRMARSLVNSATLSLSLFKKRGVSKEKKGQMDACFGYALCYVVVQKYF